jgi:predicted RNA-binding Zn-ribbon protein involved in translation (DUF1610 family)
MGCKTEYKMTLRCPKCGSKRVIFLSTTDGTAVGSTDQRYLCKDCGYRGSLILDDSKSAPQEPFKFSKPLIILDLVLFLPVLAVLVTGIITSAVGLLITFAWMAVFLITIVLFGLHFSQDVDEWYQYGLLITTGILVAMFAGLIVGFDIYGIVILMPFAVMGIFALNWMFIDRSEEAIDKDLEKLRQEMT